MSNRVSWFVIEPGWQVVDTDGREIGKVEEVVGDTGEDIFNGLAVSTDWLDRAALLMAPVNPARYGGEPGFRFRVARTFGYGASAEMTRRCLERVDDEGIRGVLRILRVLSDTDPVSTQGPVWYVEGRSV